jgi:hypothetical protein
MKIGQRIILTIESPREAECKTVEATITGIDDWGFADAKAITGIGWPKYGGIFLRGDQYVTGLLAHEKRYESGDTRCPWRAGKESAA